MGDTYIINKTGDKVAQAIENALQIDDKLQTQKTIIDQEIQRVESIAKGRVQGFVFDTEEDMFEWVSNSSNTQDIPIGCLFLIRETDVPDYWWDGESAQISETSKVDLTEYAKKSNSLSGYGITDAYTKKQADEKFQDKLSEEQLKNISNVTNKAEKATTLEGYGITDAYTKEQTKEIFQDKLTEKQLQNIEDVPNKAPKATTLEGYGITDAYTKEQTKEIFQYKLSEEQIKNIDDVQNKVTKEDGKGLSTNDYTDEEKQEVAKIAEKADKIYVNNNFANALKGNVIGQSVNISDVSPIQHNMGVKVQTKNLYSYNLKNSSVSSAQNATIISTADNEITLKGAEGNSGTAYSSGWFYFYHSAYTGLIDFAKDIVTVSLDVTLVEEGINGATFGIGPRIALGTPIYTATETSTRISFTTSASVLQNGIYVTLNANILKIANVQFEYGTESTEYTPYVSDVSNVLVEVSDTNGRLEEITPRDGMQITSSYPDISFTNVSGDESVMIEVTYNRDINKAFSELEEKLTNAVISLGGNV